LVICEYSISLEIPKSTARDFQRLVAALLEQSHHLERLRGGGSEKKPENA